MKMERRVVLLFTYIIGPSVFLYMLISTMMTLSWPRQEDDVAGFLRSKSIIAIRIPSTVKSEGVFIIDTEGLVTAPDIDNVYISPRRLNLGEQQTIQQIYEIWCGQPRPFHPSRGEQRYRVAVRCKPFDYRDGYLAFEEFPLLIRDLLYQQTPPAYRPTPTPSF